MGIVVKNQEVTMPKGFSGSYIDHVVRLGIKRALQNKKQRDNKLNKQAEVTEILRQLLKAEAINDSDTTQPGSSQRTWLPSRGRGVCAECLCRMPNVCAECRMSVPNAVLRVCS
jgi:hypothetical protein